MAVKRPVTRSGSGDYRTEIGTVGDLPWCDIFNTEGYFRLHQCGRDLFFSQVSGPQGEVHAVVHFSEIEPGIFRSPARGTYGGIDLKTTAYTPLIRFLDEVEAHLRESGARTMTLSTAPFAHDPQKSAWLFQNLSERNYVVELSQLSYSVPIDDVDLVHKMKHNNRKRLRKCAREGFVFSERGDAGAKDVYDVIARNRAHRGYPISMSFAEIERMMETFPGALTFYAVHHGDEMVASAVCVRLNERVIYTLYWGDVPGYGRYSPVAFLAAGVYAFAREKGFTLMDTGTVPSIRSGPAAGLIKFKENLGCKATLKLTYSKEL